MTTKAFKLNQSSSASLYRIRVRTATATLQSATESGTEKSGAHNEKSN